jgi:hypothetical protein
VLISVLGPYFINRKVRSYDQMISTFVFEQNAKFEALQASLEKPKLREFIKCALIMQLPE